MSASVVLLCAPPALPASASLASRAVSSTPEVATPPVLQLLPTPIVYTVATASKVTAFYAAQQAYVRSAKVGFFLVQMAAV